MGSQENCGATFEAIITIRAAQCCGRMNQRRFKLVESSLIGAGWQRFDTADIQRIGFVEISPTLSPPLQHSSLCLCTSCSVCIPSEPLLESAHVKTNYKTRRKCKPNSALCSESFGSLPLRKQQQIATKNNTYCKTFWKIYRMPQLLKKMFLKTWTITRFSAVKFAEGSAEGTPARSHGFQSRFVVVVFLIVLPIISLRRLNYSIPCVHFKGVYCIINAIFRLDGDNGRAILVSETVI